MQSLQEAVRAALREWHMEEAGTGSVSLAGLFVFPEAFPGFAGHFPGQPVLPAVIQLAAVRHLVELALDRQLVPVECRRAKFRDIARPLEELEAKVILTEKEDRWLARFALRKGNAPVASGDLVIKGATEE